MLALEQYTIEIPLEAMKAQHGSIWWCFVKYLIGLVVSLNYPCKPTFLWPIFEYGVKPVEQCTMALDLEDMNVQHSSVWWRLVTNLLRSLCSLTFLEKDQKTTLE